MVGDLDLAAAEDGAVDVSEANVNITDEEKEQRLALGEYIMFSYFWPSRWRSEITLNMNCRGIGCEDVIWSELTKVRS